MIDNSNLYQEKYSVAFYEKRYEQGYMDEWPIEQKKRVFEVIRKLDLPKEGNALDFGCGNGVFTEVLKQALPNWQIYGCDISSTAIRNASSRFSNCEFFIADDPNYVELKFDLLFSHHVLEHVFDLNACIEQVNNFLQPQAFVLLIFPCGNEDSLEYNISKMRINGINSDMENRFFFEDEGHVRRLTTFQVNNLMLPNGFQLKKAFYANQYFGAIKWISQSNPALILDFTDHKKAIDLVSAQKLKRLRMLLLGLFLVQLPTIIINRIKLIRKKKLKHHLLYALAIIPNLISYPIHYLVDRKAQIEWERHNDMNNGSEMFLFYKRGDYNL